MATGSRALRQLYLDPDEVRVAWLLDPDNAAVTAGLRAAADRTAEGRCDADALAADLPDLLVLLRERHFGLATGIRPDPGLDGWAATWRQRLVAQRPDTWGGALGTAVHELRRLVGDRHLQASGEDPALLRRADPRAAEPVLGEDPGPQVGQELIGGVLMLRIRTFGPTGDGDRALARWRDAHDRHFGHDRVVVDVRGNPRGGSTYARDWIAAHVPTPFSFVPGRRWLLDGQPLILWNGMLRVEAVDGPDAVPEQFRALRPAPGAGSGLSIDGEQWSFPRGSSPWRGRMLVLTDRATASAGESVAWLLRGALGARIAGGRSAGCCTYGDIMPYLLPRSGLQVWLASRWDGFPAVELVGLPVDVPLDPRTPLAEVARRFDQVHRS